MICSISGEEASQAVVSPRSGAIFEKKHILNYISTSGKDPINDEPLKAEELIDIQTETAVIPPKPPSYNSIPSMLSSFQNEWDALALEVFTLRKQLHKTREELSAALYHYDAATRVAARAIKERDEVKEALQQLSGAIGNGTAVEETQDTSAGVEKIPAEEIGTAREELYQLHKSQKPTLKFAADAQISINETGVELSPFKKIGVVSSDPTSNKLAVVSTTGSLVIYEDIDSIENITKINHRGKIEALSFARYKEAVLPIYACKNELIVGNNELKFKHQHKDILKIIAHPRLHHFFILLSSNSWSFIDLDSSTLYKSEEVGSQYVTGDIHVDGALFALANNEGIITIHNVATVELALTVNSKHNNISKIIFAPNGYWMLVSSSDGEKSTLEVFDLRKNKVVHSIDIESKIADFFIDPSSSLVVIADSSKTLTLHRFLKKEKRWANNISSLSVDSTFKHLSILTSVADDDFINESKIKFASVGENSPVTLYNITA